MSKKIIKMQYQKDSIVLPRRADGAEHPADTFTEVLPVNELPYIQLNPTQFEKNVAAKAVSIMSGFTPLRDENGFAGYQLEYIDGTKAVFRFDVDGTPREVDPENGYIAKSAERRYQKFMKKVFGLNESISTALLFLGGAAAVGVAVGLLVSFLAH